MNYFLLKDLPKQKFQSGPRQLNKGEVYEMEKEVSSNATYIHLTPASGGTTVTITKVEWDELTGKPPSGSPNNPKMIQLSKPKPDDPETPDISKVRPSTTPQSGRPSGDRGGHDSQSLYMNGPEQDYQALPASVINMFVKKAGFYIAVKELPTTLIGALGSVGYGRSDIEIITQSSVSSDNSAYGDGYRGYVLWVNILTGEQKRFDGSYGGSNMFSQTVADDSDQEIPLPINAAIIKGQIGGNHPVSAIIFVGPETLAKLIPEKDGDLTDRQKTILHCVNTVRGGKYRLDEFRRGRVTPEEITALVEKGYLKQNKAGAISITTEGKNEVMDMGHSMINWPNEGGLHMATIKAPPEIVDKIKLLDDKWMDNNPGGLGDKNSPSDFDEDEVLEGALVELEHTDDFKLAVEIAVDHLSENPTYYTDLRAISSLDKRGGGLNIFLDDERQTPDGYIRTYTVAETIKLISEGNCSIVSLDNDLGEGQAEGFNVANWIEEKVYTDDTFMPPEIRVHSANPVRRDAMLQTIESIRRQMERRASITLRMCRANLVEDMIAGFQLFRRANPAEISRGTSSHVMQEIIQFSKDHAAEFVTEANAWFSSNPTFQAQVVKMFAENAIPFGANTLKWMWDTVAKEGLNFFVNFGNFVPLAPKEASSQINLFKEAIGDPRFWYKDGKIEWLRGGTDHHMKYMWDKHKDVVDPDNKHASSGNFIRENKLTNYDIAFKHGYIRGIITNDTLMLNHPSLANAMAGMNAAKNILDSIDEYDMRTFQQLREVTLDPSTYDHSARWTTLTVKELYNFDPQEQINEHFENVPHETTPGSMWLDKLYSEMGIRSASLSKSAGEVTLEQVIRLYGDDPEKIAISRDDTYGRTDVYVNSEDGSVKFTFQYGVLQSFNDEPAVEAFSDSGQTLQEWHEKGERHRSGDLPARILSVFEDPMVKEIWHNGSLEEEMKLNDIGEWDVRRFNDGTPIEETKEEDVAESDEDFLRGLGISSAESRATLVRLAEKTNDKLLQQSIKILISH